MGSSTDATSEFEAKRGIPDRYTVTWPLADNDPKGVVHLLAMLAERLDESAESKHTTGAEFEAIAKAAEAMRQRDR